MSDLHFALLGDPVEHSRSPRIHRCALSLSGLAGDYQAIKADGAALETAVADLRVGALDGLNITMPLKGAASELADWATPLAVESESVNTLRAREGRIEGHSTDADAFRQILGAGGFRSGPILVLGSGGSARAALASVKDREMFVQARDRSRAEALSRRYSTQVVDWGSPVGGAVLINATPLGMAGEHVPSATLGAAQAVIDLPYGDLPTPAALSADANQIPIVDGVEFLAMQAMASFRWWTGLKVDLGTLIDAARNV